MADFRDFVVAPVRSGGSRIHRGLELGPTFARGGGGDPRKDPDDDGVPKGGDADPGDGDPIRFHAAFNNMLQNAGLAEVPQGYMLPPQDFISGLQHVGQSVSRIRSVGETVLAGSTASARGPTSSAGTSREAIQANASGVGADPALALGFRPMIKGTSFKFGSSGWGIGGVFAFPAGFDPCAGHEYRIQALVAMLGSPIAAQRQAAQVEIMHWLIICPHVALPLLAPGIDSTDLEVQAASQDLTEWYTKMWPCQSALACIWDIYRYLYAYDPADADARDSWMLAAQLQKLQTCLRQVIKDPRCLHGDEKMLEGFVAALGHLEAGGIANLGVLEVPAWVAALDVLWGVGPALDDK